MHPGEVFPLYRFGRAGTGPIAGSRFYRIARGLSERKGHDMCKHTRSRIAHTQSRRQSPFDSTAGSYGPIAWIPADIKDHHEPIACPKAIYVLGRR